MSWTNSIFSRNNGKILYFISDGDFVKVGVANDVYKRLRELQTGNPQNLFIEAKFEGLGYLESYCHNQLKKFHYRNEWFKIDTAEAKNLLKLIIKDMYERTIK